ncbi:MAG: hypothetical protein SFY80_15560 [Verrucomicrobiota bacterium]|nr:hypothetical protein [Verrucomicrobiota bacterium]
MANSLLCLKCKEPLSLEGAHPYKEYTTRCRVCRSANTVIVLPAMEHRFVRSQASVAAELEASCFYHADRKAESTCHACGRFICNHCTATLDDETLCLPCLMAIRAKGSHAKLANGTVRWDSIALGTAVVSIFIAYFAILTAPAVIYLVLRYWRKGPFSPFENHKWRMALALTLAVLQLVGWSMALNVFISSGIFKI